MLVCEKSPTDCKKKKRKNFTVLPNLRTPSFRTPPMKGGVLQCEALQVSDYLCLLPLKGCKSKSNHIEEKVAGVWGLPGVQQKGVDSSKAALQHSRPASILVFKRGND